MRHQCHIPSLQESETISKVGGRKIIRVGSWRSEVTEVKQHLLDMTGLAHSRTHGSCGYSTGPLQDLSVRGSVTEERGTQESTLLTMSH